MNKAKTGYLKKKEENNLHDSQSVLKIQQENEDLKNDIRHLKEMIRVLLLISDRR